MGKYLLTLISVGSRAVFSLIFNKWVAVHFGTAGVVLFGQFQNAMAIATATPTDALQRGFIKYQSGKAITQEWVQLLFISHIIAALLAFPVWLSVAELLPNKGENIGFMLLSELGLISMLLGSAALSIEQAKLAFTKVNILQIAAVAAVVLSAIILSLFLPLGMSLAISLAFQGLPLLFLGKSLMPVFKLPKLSSLPWKPMLSFAGAMLVIALLGRITDMWTRTTLLNTYGTHKTGLWQAVQKLSELYFVPLTAVLNLIFFAKASSLTHSPTALSAYFSKWLLVTLVGSLLALSGIYLLRTELLVLLNADNFSEAATLIPQQLIGDFFKSISYIIAMLAIAKGLMKRVIITEIASVVIYVSLVIWQTQTQSFANVSLIHSIRYFAYFLIYVLQLAAILKSGNSSSNK